MLLPEGTSQVTRPADRERRAWRPTATPLSWLLAASALLLILWSFAVPVFEAPDEPHHWQYAQYLHQNKKLPLYGPDFIEAYQPPTYYVLVAPFASASDTPTLAARFDSAGRAVPQIPPRLFVNTWADFGRYWPLRITLLATCILSLFAVYFAYLSGREAAGNSSTGLLAGGLTAFLPQFTFRGMNISNDALVTATSAAAVYVIIRLARRGFTLKLGLIAALAIAAAVLSKVNSIFLPVPFALVVLTEKGTWLERVKRLLVLGVGLLAVTPWFVYNTKIYGNPLATGKVIWAAVPSVIVPKGITSPFFRTEFPVLLWRSFVGLFGWMNVIMPDALYRSFAALGLLGIIGYALHFVRHPKDRRLALVLLPVPVLALLAVIQYNLTFSQPQGRYLFPALTAIAVLIAIGIGELPGWGRRCTYLTVIALAVVNLAVLVGIIIPAYWAF
jgi:4-amino-4-deoxy-L-arabinose transferase-like glycosyltransferase